MAVFVNTNVSGLHGQRYLNNVQNSLSTTYNRLSSGLRINSAKDDAAGLQIADRLTTQINGLNQGNRNTSDGIALAQTIEGGLDEIGNNLQRIRTLAVQAANGTNTSDDRKAISKEAGSLSAEITRIAEQTKFGGKTVLMGGGVGGDTSSIFKDEGSATAGSAGTIDFQVGANKGDTVSLSVKSFQMQMLVEKGLGLTINDDGSGDLDVIADDGTISGTGNIGSNGLIATADAAGNLTIRFALSVASGAQAAIATIDKLIATVDEQRGDIGAIQNRLESSIRNQANVSANQADARSRIRDTDFAEESANLTQQNILQQAASSMLMQANMRPQLALSMLG